MKSIACYVFGFILCCPLIAWGVIAAYSAITFNINCAGHLKRAADASTIELAQSELEFALTYLEKKEMTSGSTALFWTTPSLDVGFWYKNLKASHDELTKVTAETTQLERTNILMKLRETLLDHNKDGDDVTHPASINQFPYIHAFFWSCVVSVILALVGCGLFFAGWAFWGE